MGCQVSVGESDSVSKDNSFRNQNDVDDDERGTGGRMLSELHLDCLNSTWPLIACNKITHGHQVFREMFDLDPKLKSSFKFK